MKGLGKTTYINIGEHEFTINHWSPTRVMKNMPKIGRYFAVPMATIAGSVMSGGATFSDALPTAFLYLFEQMEEDDIMKLIDLIIDGVEVDSVAGKIIVDEVFEDNVMGLLQLVTKVLEVNYGCFFEKNSFVDLRSLMAKFGMVQQITELENSTEI